MAKKTKWTKKEIEEFKKIIISKRDQVEIDIEESQKRADDLINSQNQSSIYSSHMADAGSDQQALEDVFVAINRENTFLQYLERSLVMMEDGTFGICKKCKCLIDKERLIEVPHTTKCFDCKTAV
tara:strand:+ start:650 stop:1024 length:375 start_codon:yes stop_codon:yes gene_type:complete